MKTLQIIATLILTVSLSSQAAFLPGWERPIKQAEMNVVEAKGLFSTVHGAVLVQNRRDGVEAEATTFTLSLDYSDARDMPKKVEYRVPVKSISYGDNGEAKFHGELLLQDRNASVGQAPELEITIQRDSVSTWSADIQLTEKDTHNTVSLMRLVGEPDILFTIQSLQHAEM